MQLVININEDIAHDIIHGQGEEPRIIVRDFQATIADAIKNGTPLPEHHGDLKDVDEIVKAIEDRVEFLRKNDAIFMRLRKDIDILGCVPKIRCEVPTIISATKEGE